MTRQVEFALMHREVARGWCDCSLPDEFEKLLVDDGKAA
jgi:hypothetical protein